MKWVTVILSVALFLAPFVLGYSDNSTALWTSLILGVVLGVLGYVQQHKPGAVVAVVTVLTPFILGFSDDSAALWPVLIIGIAYALLAGYQAWFSEASTETAGQVQHRHT